MPRRRRGMIGFIFGVHCGWRHYGTCVAFLIALFGVTFDPCREVCAQQELRPFTVEDLFKLEQFEDITVSPDGKTIAYVRRRSLSSARVFGAFGGAELHGQDRTDVWLASVSGAPPINLTNGASDNSGWFEPCWSPDGAYLAMLSTRGGDNVRLWIWEKSTGRLKRLSDRGIWIDYPALVKSPVTWIDNNRLATTLLPPGEKPRGLREATETATVTMREWPKVWAGREPTSSILESGVPLQLGGKSVRQITIFDVVGRQWTIASASFATQLSISPDGLFIAFLKRAGWLPPNPKPGPYLNWSLIAFDASGPYQLVIASLDRLAIPPQVTARFVVPGSFRWSPHGHEFAFIGIVPESDVYDSDSLQVFRGDSNGTIKSVPRLWSMPNRLIWAEGDSLLISATKNDRLDWWLALPETSPRNLTIPLKIVPSNLLPTGEGLIGVLDGDVLRLDLNSGQWTNLTAAFTPKISAVVWPKEDDASAGDFSRIIVSYSSTSATEYGVLDLGSGNLSSIRAPSPQAELVAFAAKSGVAVFSVVDRNGTFLSIVRNNEYRAIAETNTFLREVAEGERRKITYRSLDGRELTGWLVLPVNYQSGKRYPLVTRVYASDVLGGKPYLYTAQTGLSNQTGASGLDVGFQLLAARGYAVLWPSMPLESEPNGKDKPGSDPLLELTNGVLPAIDKAIELGIADPQRLAVMGHSYGGYSTYGLVTQTNRFKAAIAWAGPTDLLSFYGTFATRYKVGDDPNRFLESSFVEIGQGRIGNPPWKDFGRYVRNSPIFYVDRVQTPLLIVHGDLDQVPIQQAEEFFTALYRQGKRARFLRYSGEGHTFESPANIRDMWTQIYAWLDEFCDISRDSEGNFVFNGDYVKSRNGAPPLKAKDFNRFDQMELRSHAR